MATTEPLIGIPCRRDRSGNYRLKPILAQAPAYIPAVVQAGGVPFLIPLDLPETGLRQLYGLADGLLLAGGGDVDPARYGAGPHPTLGDVQPERDALEITLTRWAAAEGKPLLAICRGIQVVSVALGGTLWQDIPSQLPKAVLHRKGKPGENPPDFLAHPVRLTPTSRLVDILQAGVVLTNSLHHQAVRTVAEPLTVAGYSADGIIEAVEIPGHPFFVGVQWHPELLVGDMESARRLFRAFVSACREG